MSTAYLAVCDRTRPGVDPDGIHHPSVRTVGASRPSAVRALLARSITMTALEIERRIRTLRRRPHRRAEATAEALTLPKLVNWHERQADRARRDLDLAKRTGIGFLR